MLIEPDSTHLHPQPSVMLDISESFAPNLLLAVRAYLLLLQPLVDALLMKPMPTWQLHHHLPFLHVLIANRAQLGLPTLALLFLQLRKLFPSQTL